MFFADLRLEAFEVAEILLRQLLLRRQAPVPYDNQRTRIHPMGMPAHGLHPLLTKATLILAVAHRIILSERERTIASIALLVCKSNIQLAVFANCGLSTVATPAAESARTRGSPPQQLPSAAWRIRSKHPGEKICPFSTPNSYMSHRGFRSSPPPPSTKVLPKPISQPHRGVAADQSCRQNTYRDDMTAPQ